MTTLLIIIHILVSLFLIAIVLLQHGKGADIGATFGGSSQSLFGSEGPVPLLNKITTFSAIIFMGTSISLAYLSANKSTGSVMSDLPAQEATAPVQQETPVTIPMQPTTATQDDIAAELESAAPVQQAVEPETPAVEQNEPAQQAAPQVQFPPEPTEEKQAE
ncbi:MAG: preprotein translocase subunit SecG [Candidatus Electrothrix sp. AR4]|nr:preprotein translocase subunit SecG [Candidatus Electrothrix sp. AR4]